MTLLLGIDEGTSAVKAVLYDARPAAGGRGAAREAALASRAQAGSSRIRRWCSPPSSTRSPRCSTRRPSEIDACGLDHQGESVLAWDADTGRPLTPVVTWQDKRSQEVLDRLEAPGAGEEVRQRSGMPLDPYFSAGKLAWLLEHDEAVGRALDAGTLRIGTVDSFLCDRLGAGFATDPSTASRTQLGAPEWDPALLEIFGVPAEVLPAIADTAGDLGTLRHPSWSPELPLRARCVDQQAALAGAGCVRPGLVKATYGTGVFVLAHAGDERPEPGGGLLPTVAWRVGGRLEWAIDGGVFTAGALLEWLAGTSDSPPIPPRWRRPPPRSRRRRRARAAGAGGRRRAVVEAGGAGGDRRADRRLAPCARRARGARGDRVAGRRRGRPSSARASRSRCCASTAA